MLIHVPGKHPARYQHRKNRRLVRQSTRDWQIKRYLHRLALLEDRRQRLFDEHEHMTPEEMDADDERYIPLLNRLTRFVSLVRLRLDELQTPDGKPEELNELRRAA